MSYLVAISMVNCPLMLSSLVATFFPAFLTDHWHSPKPFLVTCYWMTIISLM